MPFDRPTERDFAFAVKAARLGRWTVALPSQRLVASSACRRSFGIGATEPFDLYPQFEARIHPEDRGLHRQKVSEALASRTDLDSEFRVMRADGSVAWVQAQAHSDYDASGSPVRMAGITLDITERRDAESRQKQLLDELNHRVKNMLATVQSIARQSHRSASSPADFVESLDGRLHALASVHDLLARSAWDGASFEEIVRCALTLNDALPRPMEEPARQTSGAPVFGGPRIRCSPNAAVTLTMAFHELAANASAYGALSAGHGQLAVTWEIDSSGEHPMLHVHWREAGGPAVAPPDHRGFGRRLVEQGLVRELGGDVSLDFAPDGFVCLMRLPLSSKLEAVV